MTRWLSFVLLSLSIFASSHEANAQGFPTGVIRIIVPTSASTSSAANFNTALGAAQAEMADGAQRVVFVAGSIDGWLFWSTDSDRTTIEESARLVGLNSVNSFAHGDLM